MRGGVLSNGGSPGLWGALLGLIVFAFIAVPLSAAVRYATHPASQQLFAGRLIGFEPVVHTRQLLDLVRKDWRATRPLVEWAQRHGT